MSSCNFHFVGCSHEFIHLFCSQFVGIDAEDEAAERRIEHGMVFLGERVFHFSYRASAHQFPRGRLVVGRCNSAPYDHEQRKQSCKGGSISQLKTVEDAVV